MKLFTGLFVNKYEFENALVLKFKHFDIYGGSCDVSLKMGTTRRSRLIWGGDTSRPPLMGKNIISSIQL